MVEDPWKTSGHAYIGLTLIISVIVGEEEEEEKEEEELGKVVAWQAASEQG